MKENGPRVRQKLALLGLQVNTGLEPQQLVGPIASSLVEISRSFEGSRDLLVDKVRKHKSTLKGVVKDPNSWSAMMRSKSLTVLDLGSGNPMYLDEARKIGSAIADLERKERLTTSSWEIFLSLAHMAMNRRFSQWDRGWEYLVYSEMNRILSNDAS